MSTTKAILTAAAICFASSINAHMIMNTPTPYARSNLTSSPLLGNGLDFPCKLRPGVYSAEGAENIMPQGSKQTLSFIGSAVHGGGSCQISLTTDLEPTKDSTFKVIHSIEGGCPARNTAGNNAENAKALDPDTYTYTIPSDLATGQYTLAWTWFNKVGNREMYMNCAPVTVTGAGSSSSSSNTPAKRDAEDEGYGSIDDSIFRRTVGSLASLASAPEMFVANIPAETCRTTEGTDLKFPQPGDSVEHANEIEGDNLQLPVGSACPGMGSGTPTGAGAANTGGVFAGGANTASGSAAAGPSSVETPAPSGTSSPTVVTAPVIVPTTATDPPAVATSSSAASAPSSAAPSPASSGTTSTAGALTGPCTSEGDWNCIGGNSFQRCASGSWSGVQPMASGMSCQNGQSATLNMVATAVKHKRAHRFSRGHVKRGHSGRL